MAVTLPPTKHPFKPNAKSDRISLLHHPRLDLHTFSTTFHSSTRIFCEHKLKLTSDITVLLCSLCAKENTITNVFGLN